MRAALQTRLVAGVAARMVTPAWTAPGSLCAIVTRELALGLWCSLAGCARDPRVWAGAVRPVLRAAAVASVCSVGSHRHLATRLRIAVDRAATRPVRNVGLCGDHRLTIPVGADESLRPADPRPPPHRRERRWHSDRQVLAEALEDAPYRSREASSRSSFAGVL